MSVLRAFKIASAMFANFLLWKDLNLSQILQSQAWQILMVIIAVKMKNMNLIK